VVEVLVEGPSRRGVDSWKGRTRANRIVNFPAEGPIAPGDFVQVLIVGAGFLSLDGRVADGAGARLQNDTTTLVGDDMNEEARPARRPARRSPAKKDRPVIAAQPKTLKKA
jgi:hypothetical protein